MILILKSKSCPSLSAIKKRKQIVVAFLTNVHRKSAAQLKNSRFNRVEAAQPFLPQSSHEANYRSTTWATPPPSLRLSE